MIGTAALPILYLFLFIAAIAIMTGLLVRSAAAGRLRLRAGLSWALAFGIGMCLIALPGLVFFALVRERGWPMILEGWHDADPGEQFTVIFLMALGTGLALAARPSLIELDERLRGKS